MIDEALYCDDHGWCPPLKEVVDRLRALTNESDGHFLELLKEKLPINHCPCGHHLVGSVDRALEVLGQLEVDALEEALRLGARWPRGTTGEG